MIITLNFCQKPERFESIINDKMMLSLVIKKKYSAIILK